MQKLWLKLQGMRHFFPLMGPGKKKKILTFLYQYIDSCCRVVTWAYSCNFNLSGFDGFKWKRAKWCTCDLQSIVSFSHALSMSIFSFSTYRTDLSLKVLCVFVEYVRINRVLCVLYRMISFSLPITEHLSSPTCVVHYRSVLKGRSFCAVTCIAFSRH